MDYKNISNKINVCSDIVWGTTLAVLVFLGLSICLVAGNKEIGASVIPTTIISGLGFWFAGFVTKSLLRGLSCIVYNTGILSENKSAVVSNVLNETKTETSSLLRETTNTPQNTTNYTQGGWRCSCGKLNTLSTMVCSECGKYR